MNRTRLRKRRSRTRPKGAVSVEVILTLVPFLMVTLGTLDLSIRTVRYQVISHAARQGARRAIVHGAMANGLGSWGPTDVDVLASASGSHAVLNEVAVINGESKKVGIEDMLVWCDLDRTRVQIQWPDTSNEYEDRVRVTVTTPYQSVLLFFFGDDESILSASSEMLIAH